MKTIKKYVSLNYLYYALPCILCVAYLFTFALDYRTLQYLINSIYANFFNLLMVACALVAVPNFCRLVYYTKLTLNLPDDVYLPAAASERFGGAGTGKSSSTLLQAYFEAQKLKAETEETYFYLLANRVRWLREGKAYLLADFDRIEQSVKFWNAHPEYIPYLVSDVEMTLPDGRRSMFFTREHLEQKQWLPICFLVLDEAGAYIPQELYKEKELHADIILLFRLIRHFGIKCVICEQKSDGVFINVRVVLGGTVLCIEQGNALKPTLLLDIIDFLKKRLPKSKHRERLGYVIEKLSNFASCLGFRIWKQMFFRSLDFTQYIPPEEKRIVCTNKLPFYYDDKAFANLYLAKDKKPKIVQQTGRIEKDSEMGQTMLATYYDQLKAEAEMEAKKQEEELKRQNSIKKEKQKAAKLEKTKAKDAEQ